MKRNVNRLLSLALVLVMLVGILPCGVIVTEAAATNLTESVKAMVNPEVIFYHDFENDAVDTNLVSSTPNTKVGSVNWVFGNQGTNDTATVQKFDSNYGNSIMAVCGKDATATRQYYIEVNGGTSHVMSKDKAYRFEVDVYGKLTGGVYGGFYYLEGVSGASGSDGNLPVTTASTTTVDGEWSHVVFDLQPTQNHYRVRFTLCVTKAVEGAVYFDNVKITEYTPVTDSAEIITNCGLEGNAVILSADAELSSADITLASGSSLDLNGHTLTANSVDGTEGGTLIDSSEAKSGRVIVGTTDEGVDMLYPAVNNPQLPVKAADGSYALATVNLSDAYIQQTAASDEGFTLIFRPGFGTQEIVGMVGAGTSGVDMSLELTWTDVFGQSPDEPTTIKGFETVVASAYKNGKAIYAKFTNPGDTYQFGVKVNVTSSTGVTISSDVTLDADATYVNPTELGKHYYFASNFNSYSELPTEFKGRGDVSVKPAAASSTYDSLSMGTDAENGQYVVFDSEDKSEGMSFNLDLITDAANKQYAYTNLVVEMDFKLLNGDASSTGRSAQFLNVRKPTSGGTNLIYSTGGGGIRVTKADNTSANLGTFTTEWQTMKIEIDLDDQLAQVTMDGVDKGVYSIAQIYGNYFQITKTKGDGGMGIDNLKIYRYTDTNWNLSLPT